MTSESHPRRVVPKYNGVALYDAATEPRQVLRNLRQADALTVVEDDGSGWIRVRLQDGSDGFVRRDAITDEVIAPTAPAVAANVPPPAPAPPSAPAPSASASVGGSGGMPPPPAQPASPGSRGFFSRLFDWSLREFITPSIIRFVFIVWVVLTTIALAIIVLGSFAVEPALGVLLLVLSPLIFVLNVLVIRIYMELLVVIFRIEENTRRR